MFRFVDRRFTRENKLFPEENALEGEHQRIKIERIDASN